jgi:hypothetical protein
MSHVKTDKLSARTASGTITLGESGETLTIPSGVVLTNNGTASGFGKVLQVVQATKTDTASTTSTTFVTTGLEATITPSSASNKILILGAVGVGADLDGSAGVAILRDSTLIHIGDTRGSRSRVLGAQYQYASYGAELYPMSYLDSPSTTSAITYKAAYKVRTGYTAGINYNPSRDIDNDVYYTTASSIILLEIAG